jgi:hypothetical protein
VVAGEHNKGLLGPEFQAVPQELVDKYTWYSSLFILLSLSLFFSLLTIIVVLFSPQDSSGNQSGRYRLL